MDGPSRRAHGAEPERGNLSAAMAERWGKAFLVPFGAVCQKGPAVRAEPVKSRGAPNGYTHRPRRSKDRSLRQLLQKPGQALHIQFMTDQGQQLFGINGFEQKVHHAQVHGFDGITHTGAAGHDDDR